MFLWRNSKFILFDKIEENIMSLSNYKSKMWDLMMKIYLQII